MIPKIKPKRGVSPVIATVLLITMVVVIALIIFLWFRNMNKEVITKFGGTNVEIVCQDVKIEASYAGGSLYILNNGNVPIYSIEVTSYSPGSHSTADLHDTSTDWPAKGLNPGAAFSSSSSSITSLIDGMDKVTLTPVLAGLTESGAQKLFTCQDQYAQTLAMG